MQIIELYQKKYMLSAKIKFTNTGYERAVGTTADVRSGQVLDHSIKRNWTKHKDVSESLRASVLSDLKNKVAYLKIAATHRVSRYMVIKLKHEFISLGLL